MSAPIIDGRRKTQATDTEDKKIPAERETSAPFTPIDARQALALFAAVVLAVALALAGMLALASAMA